MDRIFITGLEFDAIIGVLPHERTTAQPLRVDLELEADTARAALSKNLADTVDYAKVAEAVVAHCQAAEALLLETLAADIAGLALAEKGVAGVRVRIAKPRAVAAAEAVGVEIYRASPA